MVSFFISLHCLKGEASLLSRQSFQYKIQAWRWWWRIWSWGCTRSYCTYCTATPLTPPSSAPAPFPASPPLTISASWWHTSWEAFLIAPLVSWWCPRNFWISSSHMLRTFKHTKSASDILLLLCTWHWCPSWICHWDILLCVAFYFHPSGIDLFILTTVWGLELKYTNSP